MKQLKINSPLAVYLPRKTKEAKRVGLNLNVYRNLHSRTNNDSKKLYKQLIKEQLEASGDINIRLYQVEVQFQLFKGSARRTDKSNFYAVQAKFLYDALVELEILVDDNDKFILTEVLLPTKIDRENPRAEFIFTEVGEEDDSVK